MEESTLSKEQVPKIPMVRKNVFSETMVIISNKIANGYDYNA
jgi:hypothetical protein